MHRPSLNLNTGSRGGAHSSVGMSERWGTNGSTTNANNVAKRKSELNMSQDLLGGPGAGTELANQNLKNGGDNSPRLSRNNGNRISMNNLASNNNKQDRSLQLND